MKQWWASLSQREQKILRIGGIVAAIAFVYLLIWEPFTNKVISLRNAAQDNQQLYEWMQSADATFKRARNSNNTQQDLAPEQLLSTIDKSLQNNELKNSSPNISQGANKSVRIQFENVPFDPLINWTVSLWEQYSIDVTQFSARLAEKEGFVQADVTVEIR